MADTSVYSNVYSGLDEAVGLWGPYWSDSQTAVIVIIDSATDIGYLRTTNGGTSWSYADIETNSTRHVACYYDKEVDDTGTLLHIVFMDSAVSDFSYVNIDVATNTVSSVVDISTTLTVDANNILNRCSIGKTRSGNLIATACTQVEHIAYKSINGGTSWSSISSPFTAAAEEDWVILGPANTGDDNDCAGVFADCGNGVFVC